MNPTFYEFLNIDGLVIPAEAGIQRVCNYWKTLDSRLRGNDKLVEI